MAEHRAWTPRSGSRLSYVPALDGLRAVAVIAVLAYHADFRWAQGGFLGVSVFFTLSGFLITTLLVTEHERTGRIDLRQFWLRRAKRLLPAALITVVAVTLIAVWLEGSSSDVRLDSLAALVNVANWRFVLGDTSYTDLFSAPSPLQHFWSLSIEEQFYVAFPLVLVAVLTASRRRGVLTITVVALGVASIAAMLIRDSSHDFDRLYYGTDTRAFELLAGAGLALWFTRTRIKAARDRVSIGNPGRWLDAAGVAALGGLVAFVVLARLHASWLYDGGLVVFAALGVVVIMAAVEPGTIVGRLLGFEPLRLLGIVSYGVYLIHWPVFLWLDTSRTGLTGLRLFTLQFAVTLTLAIFLYRVVEAPVRAGRLPLVRHRLRWWWAPVGIATAVTFVLVATTGAPTPSTAFDPAASPAEAIANLRSRSAAPRRLPRVLVVGDSVASSLGVGLAAWAEDSKTLDVENYGVARCSVVEGGEASLSDGTAPTECGEWSESRVEGVRLFEPDIVVMLTGPWDIVDRRLPEWDDFHRLGDGSFDVWLVAAYRDVVRELSSRGALVVWLTAPCAAEIPGPLFETGAFDTERLTYLNERIIPEVATAEPSVHVVDLFERICPDGQTSNEVEGVPDGRPDGVHFSSEGAYALSEWLGPRLEQMAG